MVLGVFKKLIPIPSALMAEDDYSLNIEQLKADIKLMSLHVVILSNRA